MKFIQESISRITKGVFAREREKVKFLVGGVQKGGTTALDSYLRSHPQICLSEVKEVHFFDNDRIFRFPEYIRNGWYHSHFNKRQEDSVKGEVTPIYIWWRDSIRRIHEYNPNMRLIFIFRDPVSRAYSHWNMEVQRRNELRPFSEVIRSSLKKNDVKSSSQHRVYSYIERGFYYEQMKEVYKFFNKDQVLCLKQENLEKSPRATLDKVTKHIGVSAFDEVKHKKAHSRSYKKEIDSSDKEYLQELYERDLMMFGKLTGLNISDWLRATTKEKSDKENV